MNISSISGLAYICCKTGLSSAVLTILKIPCDRILFNISVSSPAMRFLSVLLWSDSFSGVSKLLDAGAGWCWIFQLTVELHSHLSIWLSRQALPNGDTRHEHQRPAGQKWDVLAELCWNPRVFTEQDLSGLTLLRAGKIALSFCLAWTSPSLLCAKAGEGRVRGRRRRRVETGRQKR